MPAMPAIPCPAPATGARLAGPAAIDRPATRRRWLGCACALGTGALFGGLLPSTARAERITEVLQRSHAVRLDQMRAASVTDARATRLQGDFRELLERLPADDPARRAQPDLLVVESPVLAETLLGRHVVAHAGMASAAQRERLFFLAHELAHVGLDHWVAMQAMYETHLPGEISPQAARRAARGIDFDATTLAHQQEYDADSWALRRLRQHGHGLVAATEALLRFPTIGDSATHPSTRKRLARLHIESPEAIAEMQELQNTGEAVITREVR